MRAVHRSSHGLSTVAELQRVGHLAAGRVESSQPALLFVRTEPAQRATMTVSRRPEEKRGLRCSWKRLPSKELTHIWTIDFHKSRALSDRGMVWHRCTPGEFRHIVLVSFLSRSTARVPFARTVKRSAESKIRIVVQSYDDVEKRNRSEMPSETIRSVCVWRECRRFLTI